MQVFPRVRSVTQHAWPALAQPTTAPAVIIPVRWLPTPVSAMPPTLWISSTTTVWPVTTSAWAVLARPAPAIAAQPTEPSTAQPAPVIAVSLTAGSESAQFVASDALAAVALLPTAWPALIPGLSSAILASAALGSGTTELPPVFQTPLFRSRPSA